MGYELLVLDIDGTVTNSEKKVLPKTREAVFQIQRMGVKVVLASGRPPEGVLPVAGELGFDRYGSYILAFNGGKILDARTGRCVFEKCLPRHLPGCLWEDAVRNQIGMAAYRTGTIVAGTCLFYTSAAAAGPLCVGLWGAPVFKKKKKLAHIEVGR